MKKVERLQVRFYHMPSPQLPNRVAGTEQDAIHLPVKPGLQLLLDNATRWNSAFISIRRALRLKEPLQLYLAGDNDISRQDYLTNDDWDVLRQIYDGLEPFWDTTTDLQSYAKRGAQGVIWEVLPCLEMLLYHTEGHVNELQRLQEEEHEEQTPPPPIPPPQPAPRTRRGHPPAPPPPVPAPVQPPPAQTPVNFLLICYQNAWEMLDKYYEMTDGNWEIYAAATLLNPCCKRRHFDRSWVNDRSRSQIEPMLQTNRGIWER